MSIEKDFGREMTDEPREKLGLQVPIYCPQTAEELTEFIKEVYRLDENLKSKKDLGALADEETMQKAEDMAKWLMEIYKNPEIGFDMFKRMGMKQARVKLNGGVGFPILEMDGNMNMVDRGGYQCSDVFSTPRRPCFEKIPYRSKYVDQSKGDQLIEQVRKALDK